MGCASASCCRCLLSPYAAVQSDSENEPSCSSTQTGTVLGRALDDSSAVAADPALGVPGRTAPHSTFSAVRRVRRAALPSARAILAEGSSLHGFHVELWSPDGAAGGGEGGGAAEGAGRPAGVECCPPLQLSSTQRRVLERWCRPPELWRGAAPAVFAGPPASEAIRQGYVTDCSLISALSVLAEYEARFGEAVLSGSLRPQAEGLGGGGAAPASYRCRLFLNGALRGVVVNDAMPVGGDRQVLCAHSAREAELWVTLLEKAVVTVMGGSYEMRGSNPGTDLFHLTGWVPESIPLRGDGPEDALGDSDGQGLERSPAELLAVFDAALEGYQRGHCVLCVGTTELADVRQDSEAVRHGHLEGVSASTGLVAGHAYPVLDGREVDGHRLLFLKNPWGRVRWRGRFSPTDALWPQRPRVAEALGYDAEGEGEDDGRFWIEWEDVLQHFSHLYLCWSPRALGLHRLEVHSHWEPAPEVLDGALLDGTDLVAFTPQFRLRLEAPVPEAGPAVAVWALLSRHVRSEADVRAHFMAASVYAGSERQCGVDALLEQGVYSNGECALVKLQRAKAAGRQDFVLAVTQHASAAAFNFTLQVYCEVPGALTPLPPLVPDSSYAGTVRGQWTPRTAGGCSNDAWSYFQNPQWYLTVPDSGLSVLILMVECPANHTVNARVFSGGVARPDALRSATSSGAYRRACCLLRLSDVAPGPYVVVVSTFRPGLCSDYRLSWHAPHPVELRPQPHPFASALGHPLKCNVRVVRSGGHLWLRMDVARSTSVPARVSVRLQTSLCEDQLPVLSLFRAEDTAQPLPCELLRDWDSERYFDTTGAMVILLAELTPGESYFLEAFVPKHGGGGSGRGEAKLYINYDGPLLFEEATAASEFR